MDIEKIISKMSLEDKIALCSGKDFWQTKDYEKYGIPSLFMSDGPHGLRKQDIGNGADNLGINDSLPATCFPAEVTTAGSWDVTLTEQIARAIAEEAKELKVGLVLGPGANIKRNPLCGRNFEYFSEDPYLTGEMAAGFIKGMESEGIGSSLKHFACNSQEMDRFISDGIIDERTLREIYLTNFEIAIKKSKPSTVMCAYTKLRGAHLSDNKYLLTDILRDEWGFEGFVVTDWGAMNDRIAGFEAGCDLSMPGGSDFMEDKVLEAVNDGKLSVDKIDASVRRILTLVDRASRTLSADVEDMTQAHHELAVKAASQGIVLLKNDESILPLEGTEKVVIAGFMAKDLRTQGAGSSHINQKVKEDPIDIFTDAIYAPGCNEDGTTNEEMIADLVEKSKSADKVIIFAGLPKKYESEGFDRDDLKMPEGHIRMIEEASKVNPNTIVVLVTGSVVECDWADDVKAILYVGLPGQGGARAIYDVIYGKTNPSGHLAESWPYSYSNVVSSEYFDKTTDALYKEGIYVGYRYFDKAGIKPRFPFGYGLSYTTFKYDNLDIDGDIVTVDVTNTGKVKGAEVVQLYISKDQSNIHRPVRELKAFTKLELEPGETKKATLELTDRSFSVWDDGWKIEDGDYTIEVSDLKKTIHKDGVVLDKKDTSSWYWTLNGRPETTDLEKATGVCYQEPKLVKGQFTMDNTVDQMKAYSLIMKIMYKSTEAVIAKQFGGKKDYNNPEFKMLMKCSAGSPLRNMQISSGIKGGLFEGLLLMANGHFFKGIIKMMKK